MKGFITILIRGSHGEDGTIEIPEPQKWYRRWVMRAGARLWLWGLEGALPEDELDAALDKVDWPDPEGVVRR